MKNAKIIVCPKGKSSYEIPVMYNPREFSVTTAATISGKGANLQFKEVAPEDFTVILFFDTYEQKTDVRDETRPIADLVLPTVENKETKQPPICIFSWGGFGYKGIIHKVSQKFLMFNTNGVPIRSELTVTFKAVVTKEEDAQFKGKEACRKLWTVKSGDRLDLIAANALKDSGQWRKIAIANRIINPAIFPEECDIGRELIIPD